MVFVLYFQTANIVFFIAVRQKSWIFTTPVGLKVKIER